VEAFRWAVARTRPQAEHWAFVNVSRLGYTAFLPLCTVRRRDRVVRTLFHNVEAPLFGRYLFIQHQPGTSWRPIRSAPGVQTLVIVGGRLEYAAVGAVEQLQQTEALRRAPTAPQNLLRPGSACTLTAGPFRGHEAAVVEVDGNNAVVAILLLGALRRVAVSLEQLSPRED
jgi:transcription antitermination factor NusG